ncbi:MAG: methyltransferase [Methanomicrobiales archaeon]|nr:methyltransferase [Methanomicrobiales archaeon]
MRVRFVPRKDLARVASADWVDHSRRPFVEGESAWVPVLPGKPFDRDIIAPPEYAGRGYYVIGDIIVIHGNRPDPQEVRNLAERKKPRGILWREALDDITRTPRTEVLFGTCGDTEHHESGFTYILDPSKVMFSQGNRNEKNRMADLIRQAGDHERVADMFAGIGYFTIPMAAAGSVVHAMEINPVACAYLRRNAVVNKLDTRIIVAEGDCRELITGTYDRIVMGHFDSLLFLSHALRHVTPGSIIHVHTVGTFEDTIRTTVEGAGFSCRIQVHKVKKYRPHAWHVVHDVTIA